MPSVLSNPLTNKPNAGQVTVLLATGGTIAGRALSALDNVGYQSGAFSAAELVSAVPPLAGLPLELENLARLDSKDMDHATWQALAQRCHHHLQRPEVGGIVITHGTDTLEETAWFLHRVLESHKAVVLTAAMRPATALSPDGPQNLHDAVTVARDGRARGVLVSMAGRVHGAADVQKMRAYEVDAFASPNLGPIARLEQAQLRTLHAWPEATPLGLAGVNKPVDAWPFVALVISHAGADARTVRALVHAGVQGLVVAGSGNGTVHHALDAALREAATAGVVVRRASRCAMGTPVGGAADAWPSYEGLSAVKARVELMLELLNA